MSPMIRKPSSGTISSRWFRQTERPADRDAYLWSGQGGTKVTDADRYELMLDDEERFG